MTQLFKVKTRQYMSVILQTVKFRSCNRCCSVSHVRPLVTLWTAARQASLSFAISQSFLKLMFIESVMPSNHLILCHSLLLLLSIIPSIRVFSNELALLIRWPKYWHFSFSISPPNEYSVLISFRIDWFDLLSKGLSTVFSNTTVWKHQFCGAQPSLLSNSYIHPYMTTGKAIVLIIWIFVGKVISLLFNMLSRFVIAFLPSFFFQGYFYFMAAVTNYSDFEA